MTVESSIDMINYDEIRAITAVQHAKQTREKVLTYLKKIDKIDIQVDIFTRKLELNSHFIEIQKEGEQESSFILKNITDFFDFDKEGATVHPEVGNKHNSEINEDIPTEQ